MDTLEIIPREEEQADAILWQGKTAREVYRSKWPEHKLVPMDMTKRSTVKGASYLDMYEVRRPLTEVNGMPDEQIEALLVEIPTKV